MEREMTIGALAEAAGVNPQTLRAWESRFGFPTGRRTEAGHRRFADADLVAVRQVLAAKEAGTPLRLAIAEVQRRQRERRSASVYRELAQHHPQLGAFRLARRNLLAASLAIEDECLARSDRPLVIGAFQNGFRFASAAERWRELARTASWCLVLADFTDAELTGADRAGSPSMGGAVAAPVHADLDHDAPLLREWSVVCLSDDFSAVLSGWEIPGDPQRRFEAVIGTDRNATLTAARVLVGVAEDGGTPIPADVRRILGRAGPEPGGSAETDRLLGRVLSRLA